MPNDQSPMHVALIMAHRERADLHLPTNCWLARRRAEEILRSGVPLVLPELPTGMAVHGKARPCPTCGKRAFGNLCFSCRWQVVDVDVPRLQALRRARRMAALALSDALGLPHSRINQMERDGRAPLAVLHRVAAYLGVAPESLIAKKSS